MTTTNKHLEDMRSCPPLRFVVTGSNNSTNHDWPPFSLSHEQYVQTWRLTC